MEINAWTPLSSQVLEKIIIYIYRSAGEEREREREGTSEACVWVGLECTNGIGQKTIKKHIQTLFDHPELYGELPSAAILLRVFFSGRL